MKKKSLFDLAVAGVLFATFLTSSFDIVGSMKIMGFTVRVAYLFVLTGVGLTLYQWVDQKKLALPEGFRFLGIWTIIIVAFIPNSPLVIRNIGYGAWLVLNVAMIFFVVNVVSRKNIDVFIRLYLLSFFVLSLFGIVQYLTPQIGLPALVVEQWWVPSVLPRVNAFTYEPSFFATYLLFGIPAMLILPARGSFARLPKWFFYTMLAVDVTALILCSSRLGILIFLAFLAGFCGYVVVRWIRQHKPGLHLVLPCVVSLLVAGSMLLLMDMRLRQVNKDDAGYTYLRGTGWNESDITKAHSLTIRLQTMKKTFDVFRQNPVVGVSLGGIAPWIAATEVSNITSNEHVKPFEGVNVLLEILAASGVIGFIFFCLYIFSLCRPLLKTMSDGRATGYYLALFWGFVLGFAMLVENQNILRTYVWTHVALMSGVIGVLKNGNRKESRAFLQAESLRVLHAAKRLAGLLGHLHDWYPKKRRPAFLRCVFEMKRSRPEHSGLIMERSWS